MRQTEALQDEAFQRHLIMAQKRRPRKEEKEGGPRGKLLDSQNAKVSAHSFAKVYQLLQVIALLHFHRSHETAGRADRPRMQNWDTILEASSELDAGAGSKGSCGGLGHMGPY